MIYYALVLTARMQEKPRLRHTARPRDCDTTRRAASRLQVKLFGMFKPATIRFTRKF